MRVARLLVRLLAAAAAALFITAVFDPAAGLANTQPGFSTQPRVVEHQPLGSPTLVELRAGRHASFDRVVFQLDGPIPSYYSVRYVPQVRLDGSGDPLPLRGTAFLEVVIRAPTHDEDYQPVLSPTRLRPNFSALREVNAPASFEGQTTAGIGLAHRVGFRVLELTNPTRIVIDLAHPQRIDDGGLLAPPQGLTVRPNTGPVGSEVIVEGRGCGNLDEPIRLVFQSGASGTVGAVDLGEFEVSEQDAFRATAVVIPANLDPLQGVGGGPTQPGTYQFTTKPPTCTATFTVTSPATNTPDTPGTLPFTGPTPPCCSPSAVGCWWPGPACSCSADARPDPPPSNPSHSDPEQPGNRLAAHPCDLGDAKTAPTLVRSSSQSVSSLTMPRAVAGRIPATGPRPMSAAEPTA